MGSSNGATRGQLRPYLSGRTPPFVLVGLLVVLGILGYSYWSLNTQYNDLQTEIQKLQDRLRVYAEKRESVEKVNSVLQVQLQTYKDENGKFKITLDKKDQEVSRFAEELRSREEEVQKLNTEVGSLKSNNEKLENTDKQKELEISSLQDQTKTLKVENQELIDAKAQLIIQLETMKIAVDKFKDGLPNNINSERAKNGVAPDSGIVEEKTKEAPLLNPDVGIPPQNLESKNPQPILPPMNKSLIQETNKAQTVAPESPDISNIDKLQEGTAKGQVNNEFPNAANDADTSAQKPDRNI